VITSGVGILGIGTFLPPDIRTNDWWPGEVVARWSKIKAAQIADAVDVGGAPTPGTRAVLAAMAKLRDDPFQGAVERRVAPEGMTGTDMEVFAVEDALRRSEIARDAIDLVLVHTSVPEYQLSNNASLLHHRVGLPTRCIALGTEASANSFMLQLVLADAMIRSGQARNALLVQSCSVSRLLDPTHPVSPLFGDGATALVVGPVSPGRGLVASSHRTDGSRNRTLIASVPNGTWYDEGRVTLHPADADGGRKVFLETVDRAKEVVDEVLDAASFARTDVDYFGVHQGTPWLREVAQRHIGLENARSIDTFRSTGYLFGSSIPLGLALAEREGLLRDDGRAVVFSGGTGVTYGALAMRWGR